MKLSILALTALVASSSAQVVTSVLPWVNGDTVIVSATATAAGTTAYATLSTIVEGADVATTTNTRSSTTGTATASTTKSTKKSTTTSHVSGISVTVAEGTQLAYSEWSSIVAPSLSAAFYATASSSASTRTNSFIPSAVVGSSIALALVSGLVGVAQVML